MTGAQSQTTQPLAGLPLLLGEVLRERAAQQPDATLFTHLAFDGKAPLRLSYREVHERARAIARALSERSLRGRPVLLLYAAGPDFAPAFYGCLLAGAIAVPAPVPQFGAQYDRLDRIARDCAPGAVLSTAILGAKLRASLPAGSPLQACPWLATEKEGASADFEPPPADPGALALLQYTSGSTAEPKGVALTQANLAHNLVLCTHAFALPRGVRIVSWLPHFHDMGLVTGFMAPLGVGGQGILMSPLAFLHRPLRWLQAISEHRGQVSGGPNFGYELCVRWAERGELGDLDLSCWDSAFAGAEPLRMATLDAFAERFRAQGFRRNALTPCYGMAEATLLVSCKPAGAAPQVYPLAREVLQRGEVLPSSEPGALRLTGCGLPAPDTRLRIVDPGTCNPLPPGRVGEIWIAGPQVAQGYWNGRSPQTFGARLADGGEGAWLRSGDLGFLAPSGELVFVDRLKDLVIVNGQNYACHDLELSAAAGHALLSADACVALSLDGGERTRLVVAAELPVDASAQADAIAAGIRAALFSTHQLAVHSIVFVPPRRLSRTTSGKLQRRLSLQRLCDGSVRILALVGEALPPSLDLYPEVTNVHHCTESPEPDAATPA